MKSPLGFVASAAAFLLAHPPAARASGGPIEKETLLCGKETPLVRVRMEDATSSEERGEAFVHDGPSVRSRLATQFSTCYQADRIELDKPVPTEVAPASLIVCGSEHSVRVVRGGKSVVTRTTLGPNARGARLFLYQEAATTGMRWKVWLEGTAYPPGPYECRSAGG